MVAFVSFLSLALFWAESVYGQFTCNDGCTISSSYVDDNYCDCPDCSDESSWTCGTCSQYGCPSCGSWQSCDGSGTGTGEPITTEEGTLTTNAGGAYFECNDGCMIDSSYVSDNYCDCDDCEDEISTYWNCDTCSSSGCPDCSNGEYVGCDGTGNGTVSGYLYCYNGCGILASWYDDGYCDCETCEDEPSYTCTTCGGCPNVCGFSVNCPDLAVPTQMPVDAPSSYPTEYVAQPTYQPVTSFTCDDGCTIPPSYVDDNWCDCPDCSDESSWTCDTCNNNGCVSCGYYTECTGTWTTTTAEPVTTQDTSFTCDDGCTIEPYYVNDNWCDCPDCSDESSWTCSTCSNSGCESCGNYVKCNGTAATGTTTTTSEPSGPFTCDDGCTIVQNYYDDDWCDCSNCEDEPNWTCNSCDNGCPNNCGNGKQCDTGGSGSGDESSTTTYTSPSPTREPSVSDSGSSGTGNGSKQTFNGKNSLIVATIATLVFLVK